MPAASRTKTSNKQAVCKKLTTLLKKRYKKRSAPRNDRPILETILFAICLENTSEEGAEAALERLLHSFHDLNEIRVSSISELASVFGEFDDAEWRALRVRSTLHYVFERYFSFDLEGLRRQNLEQAQAQLDEISDLSFFVRAYTLQAGLDAHVVPLDEAMLRSTVWLGLTPPDTSIEEAADGLKSVLRKSEAPLFCALLRRLAVDPQFRKTFQSRKPPAADEDGERLQSAPDRLTALFEEADAKAKSSGRSKSAGSGTKKTASGRSSSRSRSRKKSSTTKRKKSAASSSSRTTRKKK